MTDNTAIQREMTKNFSKQSRFSDNGKQSDFFSELYRWHLSDNDVVPDYELNSSARDTYLRDHVRTNPNMAGVLNTVIDIDKNRGWRMVGGRNQVSRFTRMCHEFEAAPGLSGWRPAISFTSRSFWESNLGFVVELGREGSFGPVRAMYTVDPVSCKLRGNSRYPLEYKKHIDMKKRYAR